MFKLVSLQNIKQKFMNHFSWETIKCKKISAALGALIHFSLQVISGKYIAETPSDFLMCLILSRVAQILIGLINKTQSQILA